MSKVIVFFAIFLIFSAGPIILQIFLSRRENKWLGFILPAISLIVSIMAVLNMAVLPGQSNSEILTTSLMAFLFGNIPTVILIAIYFAAREKLKKKREIEKMNLQDLE